MEYEGLDKKRLKRQLGIIDKWIKVYKAIGAVEACTGFGKTMIAILAIKRLQLKYPHAKVKVVVPSIVLLNAWLDEKGGHISRYGLKNIEVLVVNTYITSFHECDLLILDELHTYASEEFSKVFSCTNYKFLLGLTATLERNDGKHILLEELCPIVDTVTLDEAKREGYVSNFKTFNLFLDFSEKEKEQYIEMTTIFNMNFAKFNHNFPLAMACTMGYNTRYKIGQEWKTGGEWRLHYARVQGWDDTEDHFWSPKAIARYAQQWSYAMRTRKEMIYNAAVKLDAVNEIIAKFPMKTMVFSETADFADRVTENLGDICRSYHTKLKPEVRQVKKVRQTKTKGDIITYISKRFSPNTLKKENLELFKVSGRVRVISTVKALDEGFDDEDVEMAIMASYSSAKRQDTQRSGRAVRARKEHPDKCALIINLVIRDTQEEKWLKAKQEGKSGIINVNSVDEISLEGNILQGSIKLT